VEVWTEPRVEWHRGTDSLRHHQDLVNGAELLTRWEPVPFERTATDCFKLGGDFWIWQPDVGGIRFNASEPCVSAYPSETVDLDWFRHLIERSWLPAAYQVWGRQVLHASAVAHQDTGRVLAFTGPSGAGKSTIAYGLGQRTGWAHVADDTLAFSVDAGRIVLHPLKNDARLRPATAAFHGRSDAPLQPLVWPAEPIVLSQLFVIAGADDLATDVHVEPLAAGDSYTLLLQQAHTFTLQVPAFNQQLMRDYLALAASVPIVHLTYRRSFDCMDAILDEIERSLTR
jgi:hypothetical protein